MTNDLYWRVFLDPAYNGRAKEVIEAIEEKGVSLPAAETVSASADQVVLTLGKSEVIAYRDGRAEVVVIDTAQEAPGGVTMVPVRGVLDFFGADLKYDGATGTVTVVDGEITVVLTLGKDTALVNDREVSLARPAELKNGRTLIPLRFVGESLGYDVKWDGTTNQVFITKEK